MKAMVEQGFTLVEALVAMSVLAVASVGLIRATEAHVDLIRALQSRTVADWVAENRLVEMGLPATAPLPTSVEMLGSVWQVASTRRARDGDVAPIEIDVKPAGSGQFLTRLRGYDGGQR
ncbi:MAG: type II secretion system minor pseudopilin GspI [Janthinobacterium lividum]